MKNKFLISLSIGLFMLGMANMSNAAIYGGVDFPDGAISFADEVVSYLPGAGSITSDRSNPQEALGIPDGSVSGINYVSLGDEGTLTLRFTNNVLTTSGNDDLDLWIFEIGTNELCDISISPDGQDWINVGTTTDNTSGIDIDAYIDSGIILGELYGYVRIQDLLPHQTGSPSTGADIDAVGAISSAPSVPIPGAVWLLGSGLVGLVAARRKKRN